MRWEGWAGECFEQAGLDPAAFRGLFCWLQCEQPEREVRNREVRKDVVVTTQAENDVGSDIGGGKKWWNSG